MSIWTSHTWNLRRATGEGATTLRKPNPGHQEDINEFRLQEMDQPVKDRYHVKPIRNGMTPGWTSVSFREHGISALKWESEQLPLDQETWNDGHERAVTQYMERAKNSLRLEGLFHTKDKDTGKEKEEPIVLWVVEKAIEGNVPLLIVRLFEFVEDKIRQSGTATGDPK